MNQEKYIAPKFKEAAFQCPYCEVVSGQIWREIYCRSLVSDFDSQEFRNCFDRLLDLRQNGLSLDFNKRLENAVNRSLLDATYIRNFNVAFCQNCEKPSMWFDEKLIYPPTVMAPPAHEDMPERVAEYYNEAREVSISSNRASAALLRIAAKKLCEALGEDEPNLNKAIGNLKNKGLNETVIKCLDAVRIYGNEGGAHEGQIDLSGEDNKEVVNTLFRLVNLIVKQTITESKEVDDIIDALPKNKKAGIQARDENQERDSHP